VTGATIIYSVAGVLVGALMSLLAASKLVRSVTTQGELVFRHSARANAWTDVAEAIDSLARDEDARGNADVAERLSVHAEWAWRKAHLQAAMADAASKESSRQERRGPPPGSGERPPSPTGRA